MYFHPFLVLMFVGNCVLYSTASIVLSKSSPNHLTVDDEIKQKCLALFADCGINCCHLTYKKINKGCRVVCKCDGKKKTYDVDNLTPSSGGKLCVEGCPRDLLYLTLDLQDCSPIYGFEGVQPDSCKPNPCITDFVNENGEVVASNTCLQDGDKCDTGVCSGGECVCGGIKAQDNEGKLETSGLKKSSEIKNGLRAQKNSKNVPMATAIDNANTKSLFLQKE